MAIYCLSEHVYACYLGGQLVFLDIKKDQYSALEAHLSVHLKELAIRGFLDTERLHLGNSSSVQDAIEKLQAEKIIIHCHGAPKVGNEIKYIYPKSDINARYLDNNHSIGIELIWKFIVALLRGFVGVKIIGLSRLSKSLSHRIISDFVDAADAPHFLNDLLEQFRLIRTFFYTAKDHCYFDCAVTMFFLKSYGYNPRWVFAVRVNPFSAHCWVEVDSVLVTDYLVGTDHLDPIMII